MKPAGFLRRSIRVGRSLRQAAREKWRGFARSLVGRLFGGKAHCRSLGFPRIPVEFYGVDGLPAAFLTESRTRGPVMCSVAGIRGSLGMTRVGLPLSSRIANRMNEKQVPPLRSPEFLSRLVALANFMRLSLMKAAHVDLSDVAKQEFGYATVGMTNLFGGRGLKRQIALFRSFHP